MAGDPKHYGGGLTADASEKLTRFVDLCDQFRLPLVNFVDGSREGRSPAFLDGVAGDVVGSGEAWISTVNLR